MAELINTSLFSDGNLISYYRMEGNSNDSKGTNNGTDTGIAYSSGDGRFGQGAGFDTNTDQISLGDTLGYERTQAISTACWFKTTLFSSKKYLWRKGSGSSPFKGYGVYHDGVDKFVLELMNDTASNALVMQTSSAFSSSGTWYHVVVTYDGSSTPGGVHIYVNNVDQSLTTVQNNLSATIAGTDAFLIGNAASTLNTNLSGSLDDFAFFTKVLSGSEVSTLYNDPAPTSDTASAFFM